MVAKKNHYEVLEISKDAELIDIKKAYRRLALKYHPDRNNGSAESTEKFKDISQAYTILSDKATRSYYDTTVHPADSPAPSTSTATTTTTTSTSTEGPSGVTPPQQRVPTPPPTRGGVRDAFKQFDDLFRNDPFFNEAFQDMDGAFSHRFDNSQDQNRDDVTSTNDEKDGEPCDGGVGPLLFCGMEPPGMKKKSAAAKKRVPWSQWLMNKLGVEVSVSSISHKADGTVEASHYTSKPLGTYTNKKTRTYVEGGEQVTIMSMEKDGNTIEDKLIAGKLVERKVNGQIEQCLGN